MTNKGLEPDFTTAQPRRRFAFSGIEQRVLKRLRALGAGPRPRVLVGFSGGPDSLCLAMILERLAHGGHVDPMLVHVNHRFRPGSDDEAHRVESIAKQIGLPISRWNLPADLLSIHPGTGIEEAGRRERYLRLAREGEFAGTPIIAIAHHLDDQAETVLLHLLRGSGLKGASGMKEISHQPIPWWGRNGSASTFTIWRPLLQESKAEIDRVVTESGIEPIKDESNLDQRYRRNAIRHTVLPAIDHVFPHGRSALARFAGITGDEDELLTVLSLQALERVAPRPGHLNAVGLLAEPVALQRRLVTIWLSRFVSSDAVSLDRIEAVIELARRRLGGAAVEIGEHVAVEYRQGVLIAQNSPRG